MGWPSWDDVKDVGGDLVDVVNEGGELLEDGLDKGAELLGEGVEQLSHLAEDGLDAVGLESAADWVRKHGDELADRLGADVGEMNLGETDDPKQLVHGDVAKINEGVEHLTSLGTSFGQVAVALRAIETGAWSGDDADAFEVTWEKKPKDWMKAEDACTGAGGAMATYAATLTWAQGQAELAIQQWKDAQTAQDDALAAYNADVRDYNDAVDAYNAGDTTTKPNRPGAFVDPGPALFQEAVDTLAEARKQRNTAAEDAAAAVRDATALAPPEPEFLDRRLADLGDLYQLANWHSAHFTMGFVKGTAGLVQFARSVNPTDPYNLTHPAEYTTSLSNLVAGLAHGTQHPGALINALIGEGWTTDPAEALGRLAPDVLLALATDGAGLASKADDLARAGDELAGLGDDLADLRRLDGLDPDLRDLVTRPVDELTGDELRQLREARDAITVEPGTPMQRVIRSDQVEDYLRGSSDNPYFKVDETFGFTARAEDVGDLRTPQELFDGLGLDYEGTPYRAPGDTLGPNQGGTAVDEMHVLRYEAGPDDVLVPRDSRLGGDGTWDDAAGDRDNPFTGNGYTSGGVPEFHTDGATVLKDGAEIWRINANGEQELVARLEGGQWKAVT